MAKSEYFKIVPIEKLRASKTNPRRTFDSKAQDDLVASIQEKGVLVPLVTRAMNGHFEIVAGERRYLAAKKANLKDIPIMVHDLDDQAALEIQVIENLQRVDISPLEEAEGYRALMDQRDYDVHTIAKKIGKSASYVYQTLKLADLDNAGKKALETGDLSVGHAVQIARLPEPQQVKVIEWIKQEEEYSGKVSVRDLGQHIQSEVVLRLKRAPWNLKDETLIPNRGSCFACPKRSGNTPELFSDIKGQDICTDRQCFKDKMDTWSKLEKEKLAKQGVDLVKLSSHNGYTAKEEHGKGTVGRDRWKPIEGKKTCSYAKPGLHVDGEQQGQITQVCTNPQCKVHNPYAMGSLGASKAQKERWAKQEQARKDKAELQQKVKLEATRQILRKMKDGVLDRFVFERFLVDFSRNLGITDHLAEMFPAVRMTQKPMEEKIRKMPPAEISRAGMAMLLSDDIDSGGFGFSRLVQVSEVAKRYGVNFKAIESNITKKAAEEKKAALKAQPAKKKLKK